MNVHSQSRTRAESAQLDLSAVRRQSTFLFELEGQVVGVVTLALADGRYTYSSKHLFTLGERRRERVKEATLRVDAQGRAGEHHPEGLWLWRRRSPGCVPGRDEHTGRTGLLCATDLSDDRMRGKALGAAFEAQYGDDGWLRHLRLGDATFREAPPGTRVAFPRDLFGEGLPVEGGTGPLRLSPPLSLAGNAPPVLTPVDPRWARQLARRAADAFARRPEATCQDLVARAAQWAAEQNRVVGVVHGLWASGERALPHVWLRFAVPSGTLDLDPSTGAEVTPLTHLALGVVEPGAPAERTGTLWLSVLGGGHRVGRGR